MIRSIEISNFRCYTHLEIRDCARLNVIVGDNATGKTSLLEALFLTLATSTEVAARLRTQRGADSALGGTLRRIEEALWGDFFHNYDFGHPIRISLSGDGPEARSLEIARASSQAILPLTGSEIAEPTVLQPISFTWTDYKGNAYPTVPKVSPSGLTLPSTEETLPDFFLIPASQNIGSIENATRLSELSKTNRRRRFVRAFASEFSWIKDIDIEVHGGAPMLFVTIDNKRRKIPITNVSGAVNRVISTLLAIAERDHGVVLVDEIENGIYYTHFESIWKMIISQLRDTRTQLFATTHSKECLEALVRAAGDKVDDIALWRTERDENDMFSLRQFAGEDLKAGIEYGEEVR
jgi:AAA15 family ATPase/GTPase